MTHGFVNTALVIAGVMEKVMNGQFSKPAFNSTSNSTLNCIRNSLTAKTSLSTMKCLKFLIKYIYIIFCK